jgi:AcrR family transcriptional regulator
MLIHSQTSEQPMSAKPRILRERLKEATTKEILDATESELAEHGLAATNMSSIADRAGVSVGTLYNYFRDKDVLLSTLLSDRRKLFATSVSEAIEQHKSVDFETQLKAVIGTVFDVFEPHRNYLRIVLGNENPGGSKANDRKRNTPFADFVDKLRPLIERGVKEKILSSEDSDLLACSLAALLRGVMIERLTNTTRPFRAATPFVLRIFLQGVGLKS